ncbi:MAG: SURF1 family protein, partial [Actinomycetes bacterium]
MYRFLLSWRWLGAFLLALAVAAGCVLLGHWQWDRREQRLARNALVENNYDRSPVDLKQVLEAGHLPATREWTPVKLSGSYLSAHSVLLRNRPQDGQPGYHSLVPFATDDGQVLLVDRGWLPIGESGQGPDVVPRPPAGHVELVVRLRPPEPSSTQRAPAGQLQRIIPAAVALPAPARSGLVKDAYGVLASEHPAPRTAPEPLPEPALDEGPHLSYALQWCVFALGALVGFVVIVRRTAQEDGEEAATAEGVPAPAPERPRRQRR